MMGRSIFQMRESRISLFIKFVMIILVLALDER